jgi:hypothetical protein
MGLSRGKPLPPAKGELAFFSVFAGIAFGRLTTLHSFVSRLLSAGEAKERLEKQVARLERKIADSEPVPADLEKDLFH